MRSHKSTILIALMALLLSAFVAVMAQQKTPQTDQKKQAEACCEMESCCCKGDSCPLKNEGGAANAEAKEACCCSNGGCNMKAEGGADMANAANADAKHACCGDSCEMMAKHDPAKHDPAKHDMAKTGDAAKGDKKAHASCCNAKHKDATNKEMKKQPGN